MQSIRLSMCDLGALAMRGVPVCRFLFLMSCGRRSKNILRQIYRVLRGKE